jgi:cyanophycinase-like exopeptidase
MQILRQSRGLQPRYPTHEEYTVVVEIEGLIQAIGEGNVAITRHAEIERRADDLGYEEIYFSVVEGQIIEEYPEDRPYPSCLVYGDNFEGEPVHRACGRITRQTVRRCS